MLRLWREKKSPYWYVRGTVGGVRFCESTHTDDRTMAEAYLLARQTQLYESHILTLAQPIFSIEPLMEAEIRMLVTRAKNRSQKRQGFCDVDVAFVRALFIKQRGRCSVSGIAFHLDGEKRPFAPSLDRIQNEMAYCQSNVRLVCRIANFGMNVWGARALVELSLGVVSQWETTATGSHLAEVTELRKSSL